MYVISIKFSGFDIISIYRSTTCWSNCPLCATSYGMQSAVFFKCYKCVKKNGNWQDKPVKVVWGEYFLVSCACI